MMWIFKLLYGIPFFFLVLNKNCQDLLVFYFCNGMLFVDIKIKLSIVYVLLFTIFLYYYFLVIYNDQKMGDNLGISVLNREFCIINYLFFTPILYIWCVTLFLLPLFFTNEMCDCPCVSHYMSFICSFSIVLTCSRSR